MPHQQHQQVVCHINNIAVRTPCVTAHFQIYDSTHMHAGCTALKAASTCVMPHHHVLHQHVLCRINNMCYAAASTCLMPYQQHGSARALRHGTLKNALTART